MAQRWLRRGWERESEIALQSVLPEWDFELKTT